MNRWCDGVGFSVKATNSSQILLAENMFENPQAWVVQMPLSLSLSTFEALYGKVTMFSIDFYTRFRRICFYRRQGMNTVVAGRCRSILQHFIQRAGGSF